MLSEDIINYEFSRTFKGYDIAQVEEYIENIISMYEQLANENKEISARFEQLAASFEENRKTVEEAENLNKEKDRIVSEANAEREKIISAAQETALKIKDEANAKASECVAKAESMARRLLSEAKSRADGIDSECAQIKLNAEQEAKATLDEAILEARTLMRATKLKNQERIDAAEAQIAIIRAEHDRIAKAAADFKCALYEAYSEQLISIESIEIPQFLIKDTVEDTENIPLAEQLTESAEQEKAPDNELAEAESQETVALCDGDTNQTDAQDENPATEGESDESADAEPEKEEKIEAVIEPQPDTESENVVEQTYIFAGDVPVKAHSEARPISYKKDEKYKPSMYAGIEVQKEHSGQIRYDSSDIESVNQTLDGILEKKGKNADAGNRNAKNKLGFLK